MKIFNINDFWKSLDTEESDKIISTAAGRPKVEPAPKEETSEILGSDSGIVFSNRFIHDEESHNAIKKKIEDVKNILKTKFDSTKIGKKFADLKEAVDSLKRQSDSGKIDVSPKAKIEKKIDARTPEEEEALLREIEEDTEDAVKKVKKQTTKPTSNTEKSNLKATVDELSNLVNKFLDDSKTFISKTSIAKIENAINSLQDYRGETLGQVYRKIIVPNDQASERGLLSAIYIQISGIMDNPKLVEEMGKTAAYKELSLTFKPASELQKIVVPDEPNRGIDLCERITGIDVVAKDIFHFLAETVRSKGDLVGHIGRFKISESEDGNFVINGDKITPEDNNKKYEKFIIILTRAGMKDRIVKHFESLEQSDDMVSTLKKYICNTFLNMLDSGIKKLNLNKVDEAIDSTFAFSGTIISDYSSVFKSIVRNMEMFTPSIEGVEKEIVRVENNASLQIYESNGQYYVVLYYGSIPPKRFSLESIGQRGYSNYIIKMLSSNRGAALQDLYNKLISIQIKNEIIGGKKDPKDSQYKDSKYFNQIINQIEEDANKYRNSQRKYWNIIRRAGFTGVEGHPDFINDPLNKFTISVNYNNSVSLFVEFIRLSDQTFKVNRVDLASGDDAIASKIINTISNKTGAYDMNISSYNNIGDLGERERRDIYRKITSFYTNFLSTLVSGDIVKSPLKPDVLIQPEVKPTASKKYTKDDLLKIYEEFSVLNEKEKLSPSEDKKKSELHKIVSENISEIKNILNFHEDDSDDILSKTESITKSMPSYEQNKLIRRLDELNDILDKGNSSPKIKAEIDSITKTLIERGDFSKYRNTNDRIDKIEEELLDMSIADVNPSQKTMGAAMALLKNSPQRSEYRSNARYNLDKYPHLKSYLENIYSPEFVRLVYED